MSLSKLLSSSATVDDGVKSNVEVTAAPVVVVIEPKHMVLEARAIVWAPSLAPCQTQEAHDRCRETKCDFPEVLECIGVGVDTDDAAAAATTCAAPATTAASVVTWSPEYNRPHSAADRAFSQQQLRAREMFDEYMSLKNSDDAIWRATLMLATLPEDTDIDDLLDDPLVAARGDKTCAFEREHRESGKEHLQEYQQLFDDSMQLITQHSKRFAVPRRGMHDVDTTETHRVERLMHRAMAVVMVYGYNSVHYTGAVYGVGVYRELRQTLRPSCAPNGVVLCNGPRLRFYAMQPIVVGVTPLTFARLTNLDQQDRKHRQQRLRPTEYDHRECACVRCVAGDADADDQRIHATYAAFETAASAEQRTLATQFTAEVQRLQESGFDSDADKFQALVGDALLLAQSVVDNVFPVYTACGVVADRRAIARFVFKSFMRRVARIYTPESNAAAVHFMQTHYASVMRCSSEYTRALMPLTAHTYPLLLEHSFDLLRMHMDAIAMLTVYYTSAAPETWKAIERRTQLPPETASNDAATQWMIDGHDALLRHFKINVAQLNDESEADGESSRQQRSMLEYVEMYCQRRNDAATFKRYSRAVRHVALLTALSNGMSAAAMSLHIISKNMHELGVFSLAPAALLDINFANIIKSLRNSRHEVQHAVDRIGALAAVLDRKLQIADNETIAPATVDAVDATDAEQQQQQQQQQKEVTAE